MIDDAGIQKTRDGKSMLVDLSQVQTMLQGLAAQQKLRTPKSSQTNDQQTQLVDHLKDELRRVTHERNELAEKAKASASYEAELKLLKASEKEANHTVHRLTTEVEILNAKVHKAEEELQRRSKSGIIARVNRAFDAFKD
ncbi:MAG: hypothetical protein EOP04_33185 [Proteobacteria bacterium]|nr:MAG: hypothetical protein EOP04_33185 [Pseudomonadota bacterium]